MGRENKDMLRCDSCAKDFPPNEVVEFLGKRVCGECKPDAVKSIKSGTRPDFLDETRPFSLEDAEAFDRKVLPLLEEADLTAPRRFDTNEEAVAAFEAGS